jgi:hypothetical protein
MKLEVALSMVVFAVGTLAGLFLLFRAATAG